MFRRGDTFIQEAESIPDSRISEYVEASLRNWLVYKLTS